MQTFGTQLETTLVEVWSYLPTLLAAIGVLVLGWIVALVIARLVRGAVNRFSFEQTVSGWLRDDKTVEPVNVAAASGRVAFWFSMLFVLVAFFQILNLGQVTAPLNALLSRVGDFAPRIFGAVLLLGIAWITATALRRVVRVGLLKTGFDKRLGRHTSDESDSRPLSGTLSDAVYWLVFLLFLPGVLGALSVDGMMEPVQSAIQQVLDFVPRVIGAALILTIGWFVARFVREIVTNLLSALGANELGARPGLEGLRKVGGLSNLVGLVLYVLILVPVVLSSLNALELTAVTGPASLMLERIFGAVPQVFAASLMLGLAYLVGRLISDLVESLLAGSGFDDILARLQLSDDGFAHAKPSGIVAKLTLVAIMVFASMEASSVLGFGALTELLQNVSIFGGQLVFALLILGLGFYFAGLAQEAIRAAASPIAGTLSSVARVTIVAVAAAMALQQLNVGSQLITVVFAAVFGGAALAAAIAFGIGGRETAHEFLQSWTRRGIKTSRPPQRQSN